MGARTSARNNGRGAAAAQPKTHAERVQRVADYAGELGLDGILVAVERRPSGDDGVAVIRLAGLRALEAETTLKVAHAVTAQGSTLGPAGPPEGDG